MFVVPPSGGASGSFSDHFLGKDSEESHLKVLGSSA